MVLVWGFVTCMAVLFLMLGRLEVRIVIGEARATEARASADTGTGASPTEAPRLHVDPGRTHRSMGSGVCPGEPALDLELHEGSDAHADVCRGAGNSFHCPLCCSKTSGAPYCAAAAGGPCRAAACQDLGAVHGQQPSPIEAPRLPQSSRSAAAASEPTAAAATASLPAQSPDDQRHVNFDQCDKYAVRHTGSPTFGICVLATLRYESRYMLEWLTWHRLIGVHHVWIYIDENGLPGSKMGDHSDLIGLLRTQQWITLRSSEDVKPRKLDQGVAMADCAASARGKVDWTGHWDMDEMLVIGPRLESSTSHDALPPLPNLTKVLTNFPNEAQVLMLPHLEFSTNGAIYPHRERGQSSGFTECCGFQPGKSISRTDFGFGWATSKDNVCWVEAVGHGWSALHEEMLRKWVRHGVAPPIIEPASESRGRPDGARPFTARAKTLARAAWEKGMPRDDPRTYVRLHHYSTRSLAECLMKEHDIIRGLPVFGIAPLDNPTKIQGHLGWRRGGGCKAEFKGDQCKRTDEKQRADHTIALYSKLIEDEMLQIFGHRASLIAEQELRAHTENLQPFVIQAEAVAGAVHGQHLSPVEAPRLLENRSITAAFEPAAAPATLPPPSLDDQRRHLAAPLESGSNGRSHSSDSRRAALSCPNGTHVEAIMMPRRERSPARAVPCV